MTTARLARPAKRSVAIVGCAAAAVAMAAFANHGRADERAHLAATTAVAALAGWCEVDAAERGRRVGRLRALALVFLLPIGFAWHAFATRGFGGWRPLLGAAGWYMSAALVARGYIELMSPWGR